MRHRKSNQSGNVFFTLFGAVGLVGVIGASTMTILKGPVKSMAEVTKRTVAENNMIAAGRLSIVAVRQQTNEDCDSDNFVEPLPWDTSGTGTAPTGGGFLPASVGASRQDPWGTTFGYCSWDHGTAIDNAGCGGASQRRLRGANVQDKTVIAVISAGPNRVFETTCNDSSHATAPYVGRAVGSDDMILEYTYADSEGMAGGLWNVKSGDLKTAEIDKNLEIKNAANTVLMAFDQTTDTSKPSLKVDFISKLTPAKKGVEYLSNIMLGTSWLSGDGDNEGIRIDASGRVGIGTAAPNANAMLDVMGGVTAGRDGFSGTYNSAQVQGVYSMGPQYKIDQANNTFGTQYGTVYGYQTSATGANNTPIANWGHQLLNVSSGAVTSGVSLTSGHGYFAGNLGIGTQAPGQKIDVSGGNVRTTGEFISTTANQFRAIAGNYGSFIRNDGTNTYWLLTASGDQYGTYNALRPFAFNNVTGNVTLGGSAMYIEHNANVGIGTSSPAYKLHVAGTLRVDSTADFTLPVGSNSSRTVRFGYEDANSYGAIIGYGSGSSTPSRLLIANYASGSNATGGYIDYRPDANYMLLYPSGGASGYLRLYSGGTETMRMNANGSVTIYSGDLLMNSNKITGMANPTAAQDATTKSYVDARVAAGTGFVEQDPQVGTVTSGKWCVGAAGSVLNCTADLPAGDNLGSGGTTGGALYSNNGTYGYLGLNGTNYLRFSDSALYMYQGGAWTYYFTPTLFAPYVTNVSDLGASTKRWKTGWFTDVNALGTFLANTADTAALPSYSWNGDDDTGLWRPAADVVGVTAGGQESMRFYPTYVHAMSKQIKNLAAPTAANDAVTKTYVDTNTISQADGDVRYLRLSGGTMTGSLVIGGTATLNMNNSKILNVAAPTVATDAATKSYVDTQVSTALNQTEGDARYLRLSGGTVTGSVTVNGNVTVGGTMRGSFNCRTVDASSVGDGTAYAACASDEFLMSGGGNCGTRTDGGTRNWYGMLTFSRPEGNTWVSDCIAPDPYGYTGTGWYDVPAYARAVCCKK